MSVATDILVAIKGDIMRILEAKTWKESKILDFTLQKEIFKERKK
jgi:hypothetical protein